MAWTNPVTRSDGELITAAIWNPQIVNNFKVVEHLIARKTADEDVTSSTTLQNDDHLLAALAANEKWLMRWVIIHTGVSAGAPDIKIAFTVPSGCTFNLTTNAFNDSGSWIPARWSVSGTSVNLASPANAPEALVITGRVHNGANAGNIQLQWAQVTSSAEAERVFESSSVWGMLV